MGKKIKLYYFIFILLFSTGILFSDSKFLNLHHRIKIDESKETIRSVGQSLFDDKGCFYLLSMDALRKYDQNGKFIDTLIRHGNGPNEFMMPTSMNFSNDKSNLIIYDVEKMKIIFFDTNGKNPKYFDSPKNRTAGIIVSPIEGYYIQVLGEKDDCLLYKIDKDFKIQKCFYTDLKNLEEYYPITPNFNCVVDSKGNIYISDYFVYKIFKYDRMGKLLKTFGEPGKDIKTLEGKPPKRDEGKKFWQFFSKASFIAPLLLIEDTYLFVFYNNERKDTIPMMYDIYFLDGKKIAHGSLPVGMHPCGKDNLGRLVCSMPEISEDGMDAANWLYVYTVNIEKK